jgi:hypothetical protein
MQYLIYSVDAIIYYTLWNSEEASPVPKIQGGQSLAGHVEWTVQGWPWILIHMQWHGPKLFHIYFESWNGDATWTFT